MRKSDFELVMWEVALQLMIMELEDAFIGRKDKKRLSGQTLDERFLIQRCSFVLSTSFWGRGSRASFNIPTNDTIIC